MSEHIRVLLGAPPMLLDFEELYNVNPEVAIRRLLRLLLSERSCHARVAYLLRLKADSDASRAPMPPRVRRGPFDAEIRLICEDGLWAAYENGKLKQPEVVHRLYRLTCDPDALMAAHRKLIAPPEPPPPPPQLPPKGLPVEELPKRLELKNEKHDGRNSYHMSRALYALAVSIALMVIGGGVWYFFAGFGGTDLTPAWARSLPGYEYTENPLFPKVGDESNVPGPVTFPSADETVQLGVLRLDRDEATLGIIIKREGEKKPPSRLYGLVFLDHHRRPILQGFVFLRPEDGKWIGRQQFELSKDVYRRFQLQHGRADCDSFRQGYVDPLLLTEKDERSLREAITWRKENGNRMEWFAEWREWLKQSGSQFAPGVRQLIERLVGQAEKKASGQ